MMSRDVIDVYLCWRGLYSWHKNSVIWDAIPHFLMRESWIILLSKVWGYLLLRLSISCTFLIQFCIKIRSTTT